MDGTLILHGWLFGIAVLFVLWVVEVIKEDAGVVDLGWTLGVGLLAIYYAAVADGYGPRRMLVGTLAGGWSLRLALYILLDRVLTDEEDGRYQGLRARWGAKAHFYFFFFFESQSLLIVIFALPMLVVASDTTPGLGIREVLGALIWLVSVGGESLADRQLAGFRANPANKGKVCKLGLWRYSRHPNYFFEWLHWWAYVVMAIGTPDWLLTWIGPVGMGLALLKVTGIPWAEEQALQTRGDAYRRYQKTTNAFVPWFPRHQ